MTQQVLEAVKPKESEAELAALRRAARATCSSTGALCVGAHLPDDQVGPTAMPVWAILFC